MATFGQYPSHVQQTADAALLRQNAIQSTGARTNAAIEQQKATVHAQELANVHNPIRIQHTQLNQMKLNAWFEQPSSLFSPAPANQSLVLLDTSPATTTDAYTFFMYNTNTISRLVWLAALLMVVTSDAPASRRWGFITAMIPFGLAFLLKAITAQKQAALSLGIQPLDRELAQLRQRSNTLDKDAASAVPFGMESMVLGSGDSIGSVSGTTSKYAALKRFTTPQLTSAQQRDQATSTVNERLTTFTQPASRNSK